MANVGKVHTPGQVEHVEAEAVDETVTIGKSELDDLMRRINAIESRAAPPPGVAEAKAKLPDQDDIDPSKIDRAVLSKQGWVLPSAPAVNAGKV
jgi:hypothetical protein